LQEFVLILFLKDYPVFLTIKTQNSRYLWKKNTGE
jgi:hypothetical protein